jgi:hypothetical protein
MYSIVNEKLFSCQTEETDFQCSGNIHSGGIGNLKSNGNAPRTSIAGMSVKITEALRKEQEKRTV